MESGVGSLGVIIPQVASRWFCLLALISGMYQDKISQGLGILNIPILCQCGVPGETGRWYPLREGRDNFGPWGAALVICLGEERQPPRGAREERGTPWGVGAYHSCERHQPNGHGELCTSF